MQALVRRGLTGIGVLLRGGGTGRLRELVILEFIVRGEFLLLGSGSGSASAASGPGKGKPPITIGDKNFTEEFILGDLYAQALRAKGFTVNLKPNIGSSELTDKALRAGQIDMYPEYTGVILSVLAMQTRRPASEDAAIRGGAEVRERAGATRCWTRRRSSTPTRWPP